MTKAEAIKELERCAELCPTTPLAEACRMAVDALKGDGKKVKRDCFNCAYSEIPSSVYPCSKCIEKYSDSPSRWELKEVNNGKTD